jgi:hypothetical protein
VIPFLSSYGPIWLGRGVVASDVLVAGGRLTGEIEGDE